MVCRLSRNDAAQREHALLILRKVDGAGRAAEVKGPAADLPTRARSRHRKNDPAHRAVGALTGLCSRLDGYVGRPADRATASTSGAAAEALVDRLPGRGRGR